MMRQEQQANGGSGGASMNKVGMGLMLPTIASLTSSMIAENCHLLRGTPPMPALEGNNVESSPSQSSSLDEIHQMTFAELY